MFLEVVRLGECISHYRKLSHRSSQGQDYFYPSLLSLLGLFIPIELSLQKIFVDLRALDRHLKTKKLQILQVCYKKSINITMGRYELERQSQRL